MARARNIKPAFFKNETLVELAFEYRLLFVGLWTLADRDGRLEDRPKRIKMEIFPADNVDVEQGLSLLAANGFIDRYTANGLPVIEIINFSKHQNPHHTEKRSELPDRNGELTVKAQGQDGGNLADSLIPDSLITDSLIPESGAGKPLCTLSVFMETKKQAGEKIIPVNHAVYNYAKDAGIPVEFLSLAWNEFKSRYTTPPDNLKKYRDWPSVFHKAVKGNWLKVWFIEGGAYKLTTTGQQADLARAAHARH